MTDKRELTLRCMTCWGNQNYAEDAPYQDWDKPCKHLTDIGVDIRKKLAKRAQVADKPKRKKVVKMEDECPEKLF